MVKREKANYMIQSVSHALDVIEELCKAAGEIGVTELSKRLKLHKNNVFRLLATLELRGYVEQNAQSENYRLGVKALQLGQAYLLQSDLVGRAFPILRTLSEKIGETVSLAILQNGVISYPISVESKKPVRVSPRVSTSIPAKQCASGRLLTAQLPDAMLEEILAGNSPQDAAIRNQMNELRSSGVIVDRAAIEADVLSIARIVRGNNNQVVGAIEVLIPQYRGKIDEVVGDIENAASTLSNTLGYSKTGLASELQKSIEVQAGTVEQLGRIK